MTRIEVTRQARLDRDEIIDFYGENSYGANRFIEQVNDAFMHLQRWPDSAGQHPHITKRHVRFWLIDPYYIVLLRKQDTLIIIAILHTSRSISNELRSRLTEGQNEKHL
ncbi:type II toxin-antitoxin system RelE/ParE family toxin [Terriglobus sp.]|uniref:type II toxin-antitoxin system RelE/ParE family toxin n=1 Tax=Terriglobus sp. TaxID=1889013 RepID=UPI003B005BCA